MIYFVRHGSTDWNENINQSGVKDPRCQGQIDIPLNDKGIAQANQAKELLKDINFKRIICSPLSRAKQTCEIISNNSSKIEIDNRLIERDFGEFEGLSRSEFDVKAFWNSNSKKQYIRAETIKDVENRVFDLLNELKQNPKDNVLLVSHGGVGCVLMSYFKGIPQDGNYLQFEMPNGKPLMLDFDQSQN